MKSSEERILTTHVGSLPRTDQLVNLLNKKDGGQEVDGKEFKEAVIESTEEAVDNQIRAGIDVINNGEQPRVGFDTYVYNRMTGFGGKGKRSQIKDIEEFPSYAEKAFLEIGVSVIETPKAQKQLKYEDLSQAKEEIESFKKILGKRKDYEESFMTAASPGAISGILLNEYYKNHKE